MARSKQQEPNPLIEYGRFRGGLIQIEGEFLGPYLLRAYEDDSRRSLPTRRPYPSKFYFGEKDRLILTGEAARPRQPLRPLGTVCLVNMVTREHGEEVKAWATLHKITRAYNRQARYAPNPTEQRSTSELLVPLAEPPDYTPFLRSPVANLGDVLRLHTILEEHGWPTLEGEGRQHMDWAWDVAYRATDNPGFMMRSLGALQAARKQGVVPPDQYASLRDRVEMLHGYKQTYGTQVVAQEDGLLQWPIIDPTNLDARRQALGLTPHADYVASVTK